MSLKINNLSGFNRIKRPQPLIEAGQVYIYNENCEGTGTPSGWLDGGTPNWDYTTIVLEGSHSLQLDSGESVVYVLPADRSVLYGFARLRVASIPAANAVIMRLRDSGNVTRGSIVFRTTGVLGVQTNNGAQTNLGTAISLDTLYYIWFEFITGTGTDGIMRLWVSTDISDKGSVYAQITNGTQTQQINHVLYSASTGGAIWDTLKAADEEIPNNPS